jgi:hypothetical protein
MLQGSFETFDFTEVLGILAKKRQSGKLRLHSGSAVVELFITDGKVAHAEWADHGAMTRVADNRARLEEACFQVLRWDHGSFEFHPGVTPTSSRNLDAPVDAVVAGAQRRLEDWEKVEGVIPTLDIQPRLVSQLDRDEVTISRESWRVLAAIDGRRNGHALCRLLDLSSFELSLLLSSLLEAKLIDVGVQPKVAIAPRVAGPQGLKGIRVPVSTPRPSDAPGAADARPDLAAATSDPAGAVSEPAGPDSDAGEPAEADADPKVKARSLMRRSGWRLRPANG